MSTIVFRGKTYNSVFEMPDDVRKAYQREKGRSTIENTTGSSLLTDLFEMPDEVKQIYQRALENIDEHPASSRTIRDSQQHRDLRPSDENLYRPSAPIIQNAKPAIEPESGTIGFVVSLVVVFFLLGLAYFLIQFMQ